MVNELNLKQRIGIIGGVGFVDQCLAIQLLKKFPSENSGFGDHSKNSRASNR